MKAALARRETTDIVQVNLRMREHEHLRLKAAAQSHGVSLNVEMVLRLARTFEQPDLLPSRVRFMMNAERVMESIERQMRSLRAADEPEETDDLVRAVDELTALVQSLIDSRAVDGALRGGVKATIDKIAAAKIAIASDFRNFDA
jgi:hypothetical protein